MNRHNLLQFNPNSYRKHLSPFGGNVLDTLIKHWTTGFDNKENRRRQQSTANQNRRNVGGFYNDSRPIPSIPSSPFRDDTDDRENYPTLIPTNDHHISILSAGQTNNPSNYMGKANPEKYYNQLSRFNDGHFAMPTLHADHATQPTTSMSKTKYDNVTTNNAGNMFQEQHDVRNDQEQHFKNDLPGFPIKHMLHDGTHSEQLNGVVPASSELVNTVEIPNSNDEEVLTANDMVTPVINFDAVNENLLTSRKHADKIDKTDIPPMQFLQILNNERIRTSDDVMTLNGFKTNVQWDDMFDTELLPDLNAPKYIENGNRFKIEFPKEKNYNQIISKNKANKRKTQSKVCDALSKKVKKVKCELNVPENSKKNFRKIKRTKAVKNWLEDVDQNNFLEGEIEQNTVNDTIPHYSAPENETVNTNLKLDGENNEFLKNKESLNRFETILPQEPKISKTVLQSHEAVDVGHRAEGILIHDSKTPQLNETVTVKDPSKNNIQQKPKEKSKKVVQARLAQKDGKMKFGPPAKEKHDGKPAITPDNENKNKELIKEKKAKAKFVAPIKSQIPVKNISFEVNTIDESNAHLIDDFTIAENSDIAIILIYSNGFCQLNNNHTEDACVPEGIVIQSLDQFFYFKDDIRHCDVIRKLIEGFHVICYNGKEILIHLTSKYGLELKQDAFHFYDAKIGGSLIDPDNPPENFAELQKLLGFTPEFTIATECVLQKAAWYTTLLRQCFDKLKSLLIENSVWNLFHDIEMRLLPIIAGMEHHGVCVDLEKLKSMEEILLRKMKAVEQECFKAAGKTFQINSALQVRTILYDELQLDTKSNLKIKETIGKGAKSTSETMLRGLVSVHPLPGLILEYRHLHKAHATFLTGIAQHVKDGLVKPTWVQTAAATGRIASNNPNLQAIPKAPFSLVIFPKTSDDHEPALLFRCVYTARAGHWLVAADFKHVECRVFAHAAADAALLGALRDRRDLFRVLAAKWLNKPVDEISTEDRERTKRIVYASLYGAGARKLMEILQVGYEQVLGIMTSFNRTFPALKTFGQSAVERARAGGLRTLRGRARRLPHIASADPALRAHAERQAVNFVVQGSAADLCKTAMVEVQRQLEQQAVRGRLLLQIHDELVWEVADEHVARGAAIIKEAMEGVGQGCGMALALPVALSRGRSWGDMQPFPEDSQL